MLEMNDRQQKLTELQAFIENVDKETTLLLQNLQWDRNHLIERTAMAPCRYNTNHRIPLDTRYAHEKQCYLAQQGYCVEDKLLPDPVDPSANTVVKLCKQDIMEIINKASASNPMFKRGLGSQDAEPLSTERLQQAYTADERRAIHEHVVNAAPFCHDLTDLALISDEPQSSKVKGRLEILAELRDMKRRRAKYRVAAKTRNYSHVLRDVVKTQMELYAEAKRIVIKTEYGSNTFVTLSHSSESMHRELPSTDAVIKRERRSPERSEYACGDSRRYREKSRSIDNQRMRDDDKRHASKRRHGDSDDYSRDTRKYISKERSSDQKRSSRHEYNKYIEEDLDKSKDRNSHNDRKKYDKRIAREESAEKHKEGCSDDHKNYYKYDRTNKTNITSKYHDDRKHRSYEDSSSRKGEYGVDHKTFGIDGISSYKGRKDNEHVINNKYETERPSYSGHKMKHEHRDTKRHRGKKLHSSRMHTEENNRQDVRENDVYIKKENTDA